MRAGRDAFGERYQGLIAGDATGVVACHAAAAGVYGDGVSAAEGLPDGPLGGGWASLLPTLPFGLAAFFVFDPSAGALRVAPLDSYEEAQEVESRWGWIVHTFDSRIAAPHRHPWAAR